MSNAGVLTKWRYSYVWLFNRVVPYEIYSLDSVNVIINVLVETRLHILCYERFILLSISYPAYQKLITKGSLQVMPYKSNAGQ